MLLTLALGIGANSAIFTLVNSVLLRNLPVTDPKTLVRIGDQDDCCVNSGTNDNGDYSLFATETYYSFRKNLTEFEELAATESGYAWRPITVRREGPETVARSVMGTFVSGNCFRVFGLTPAAGRFFVDTDAEFRTFSGRRLRRPSPMSKTRKKKPRQGDSWLFQISNNPKRLL